MESIKQEQVQFAPPHPESKSIEEMPVSKNMVRASTLLSPQQAKAIKSKGAFFSVIVGEEIYPVRTTDMVPETAQVYKNNQNEVFVVPQAAGG